jgi:hypothetical protein
MTANPRTLQDLGAFWTSKGGVNLGVVGNQKHCAGYHLGRDRIYSNCACKPDGTCVPGKGSVDYSVQTARDKAGLSNSASAIDLGKLNGSLANLFRFSSWLARQCLDNAPGTSDIREVIYSPDGKRVLGFKDGIAFLIPDYGDRSHLTHTHISYYRDSEARDKRPLFERYWSLPDTSTETQPMALIHHRALYDVAAGVPFYESPGGEEVGKFSKAAAVQSVGIPMDQSEDKINFRWLAVVVTTSAIDGKSADKVVFIEAVKTANQRPIPEPVAPVPPPDVLLSPGQRLVVGAK